MLVLGVVGSAGAMTLAELGSELPATVGDLTVTGEDELYGPDRIFEYLNGGAEVYLAYGLVGCLARPYAAGGMSVVADVFELASAADAFGVFTHDQDGEEVAVGQGALLRPGWLSFWKGPFFVSLTADTDSAAAQQALLDLGRGIAAAIPSEGKPPELLDALPRKGLVPRSVRYLHSPVLLRAAVPIIEGNPLALGEGTEAVLGRVRRGKEEALVILVRYPNLERARAALVSVAALVGSDPRRYGPSVAQGRNAERVAWVLFADSKGLSVALMGEVLRLSPRDIRRLRRGGHDVRMF
jgi:hypothetical protein